MVTSCPHCGHEVTVPDTMESGTVSLECPSCESRLEVSIVFDGAETLLQPQLQRSRHLADPSATVPLGSATSILEGKLPSTAKEKEVKTVPQASLVVLGADRNTERFMLTARVTTLGREAADIVIADEAISSTHLEIEARGGQFFLRDLDSSNGTFVNDERVRSARLASGDLIRAGQTTLAFKVVEAIALDPDE